MRISTAVVSAKTPGVAVLLSILWLGAGHLYANRSGAGITLMIFDALLGCLALTGVGLALALPVWIAVAPIVIWHSAHVTAEFNRRNGLTPS